MGMNTRRRGAEGYGCGYGRGTVCLMFVSLPFVPPHAQPSKPSPRRMEQQLRDCGGPNHAKKAKRLSFPVLWTMSRDTANNTVCPYLWVWTHWPTAPL